MRGLPAQKADHPHRGVRFPFSPERMVRKTRRVLPVGNQVDTAHHRGDRAHRRHPLARVQMEARPS